MNKLKTGDYFFWKDEVNVVVWTDGFYIEFYTIKNPNIRQHMYSYGLQKLTDEDKLELL